MTARAHWFEGEENKADVTPEESSETQETDEKTD